MIRKAQSIDLNGFAYKSQIAATNYTNDTNKNL
jgi:hypothetical protein